MLYKNKITTTFCIIDNILKEIYPIEDKHRKISDSQMILIVVLAARSFYRNHSSTIRFVKEYRLISNIFEESRFNRRLHQLGGILTKFIKIFTLIVRKLLKTNSGETTQQACEPIIIILNINQLQAKTDIPISFHLMA